MPALKPARLWLLGVAGLACSTPAAAATFSLFDLLPTNLDRGLLTATFAIAVFIPLFIARLAAAKARADADAYHPGLAISSFQNGLAIVGNYLSGASFLGIAALIVSYGYDGMIFALSFLVGWPFMTIFLAERLKHLGKFTLGDVLACRLDPIPIRIFSAVATVLVSFLYLAAQMVGVGQLIRLLFGFEYWMGVVIVGAMMILYVRMGGIFALTWLTIVKTLLLLFGATALAFLAVQKFGFDFAALFSSAAKLQSHISRRGVDIFSPGLLLSDPISLISLAFALICGLAGLPHVLTRFFNVPNATEARQSAFWATAWSGYFYLLAVIIGFSAVSFVASDPAFHSIWRAYRGGDNMASLYLAHAVGGEIFMGILAAVAFVVILAAMGGLILAGASSVSHDLYAIARKGGRLLPEQERLASHFAILGICFPAMLLGLSAEQINIVQLVAIAFAIAASSIFPVLALTLFWKGCTTRGALIGGYTGLAAATLLALCSKPVWIDLLGMKTAPFPYASPALFSMSLAFFTIWIASRTDKSARGAADRDNYTALTLRAETGAGELSGIG